MLTFCFCVCFVKRDDLRSGADAFPPFWGICSSWCQENTYWLLLGRGLAGRLWIGRQIKLRGRLWCGDLVAGCISAASWSVIGKIDQMLTLTLLLFLLLGSVFLRVYQGLIGAPYWHEVIFIERIKTWVEFFEANVLRLAFVPSLHLK